MTRLVRDLTDLVEGEEEKGPKALATQYSRIQAKVAEIALPVIARGNPAAAREALRAQFIEAARAELELARAQGLEAVAELQAELFSDLGSLFADPEAPEEGVEIEESDPAVKQKLVRTNFSENLQNLEQNQISDSQALDTGVQSSAPLRVARAPSVKQNTGPPSGYVREVFE
jgi:hypothetical protein